MRGSLLVTRSSGWVHTALMGDWVVMTVFLGHDWSFNCMLNVVKTSRNIFCCLIYEGSLPHPHTSMI